MIFKIIFNSLREKIKAFFKNLHHGDLCVILISNNREDVTNEYRNSI